MSESYALKLRAVCSKRSTLPFCNRLPNFYTYIAKNPDFYTQYDVDRMMSHINNAPRQNLDALDAYCDSWSEYNINFK